MHSYLGEIIINTNDHREFYAQQKEGITRYRSANYVEILSKNLSDESELCSATTEDLNKFALMLNSPRSSTDGIYEIVVNYNEDSIEVDIDEPIWRCDYSVVGYEHTMTIIRGYGDTPVEALTDCHKIFDMLQEKYNPKDASIE